MAELTDREERTVDDAVRRAVGAVRDRHAARQARGVSRAARRRAPAAAVGAELPREIFGFKTLGVEYILSASAVGSLKEEYRPLDMRRCPTSSSTGPGGASRRFSAAVSSRTSASRIRSAVAARATSRAAGCGARRVAAPTVHKGGTYVCMEGPQFSTLAESKLYRSWGMDIIGMTNLQEAKLAREAEICYATIALVTDYDCWHPDHDQVTVDMIIANLTQNAHDRAAGHRRRRRAPAVRAHLRVRDRAEARDHHAARRDPGAVKRSSRRSSESISSRNRLDLDPLIYPDHQVHQP